MSERWQTQQDSERNMFLNAFYSKYEEATNKQDEYKKLRYWAIGAAAYMETISLMTQYADGHFSYEEGVFTGLSVGALVAAGVAEVLRRRQKDKAFSAELHILQLESEKDE